MYALADDAKSSLLKRGNRPQMIHSSYIILLLIRGDFNDAAVFVACQLLCRFGVFPDRDSDVG